MEALVRTPAGDIAYCPPPARLPPLGHGEPDLHVCNRKTRTNLNALTSACACLSLDLPDDILVRVSCAGVTGLLPPFDKPSDNTTPGCDLVGVVVESGRSGAVPEGTLLQVRDAEGIEFQAGDQVVVEQFGTCVAVHDGMGGDGDGGTGGICQACVAERAGAPTGPCASLTRLGSSPELPGGLAAFAVLPSCTRSHRVGTRIRIVTPPLPPATAALAGPLATAIAAVQLAGMALDTAALVLVVGDGLAAHAVLTVLRHTLAERRDVTAVCVIGDSPQWRLDSAANEGEASAIAFDSGGLLEGAGGVLARTLSRVRTYASQVCVGGKGRSAASERRCVWEGRDGGGARAASCAAWRGSALPQSPTPSPGAAVAPERWRWHAVVAARRR